MQQVCISKGFNSYHIYQNNDLSECVCNSGSVCNSGGNVCNSGGNVCDSGEIEYALNNLRLEVFIHNFA